MTPCRTIEFVALVLCLSGISCALPGRSSEPPLPAFDGNKTIRGTVRDSLTGAPLASVRLLAQGSDPYRGDKALDTEAQGDRLEVVTDSAGEYTLRGLDAGTWTIAFRCPRVSLLFPKLFATRTVTMLTRPSAAVDVLVPPDACREPPWFERRAVYRGHYVSGFEHSYFHPCPDSTPGLPEGFMTLGFPSGPAAWTTPTSNAMWAAAEFPPRLPSDGSYTSYFVRWLGTLRGPMPLTHMSTHAYEFLVDSVLEVRRATREDCR